MDREIQEILSRYQHTDEQVIEVIEALQAEIDALKRKLNHGCRNGSGAQKPRPTVDVNLNGIQLDLF